MALCIYRAGNGQHKGWRSTLCMARLEQPRITLAEASHEDSGWVAWRACRLERGGSSEGAAVSSEQ